MKKRREVQGKERNEEEKKRGDPDKGIRTHSSSRPACRTDTHVVPKTGKVCRTEGLGHDVSDVV
jgi:hypothetical protein